MEQRSLFEKLNAIDCNVHTEQKNGLTYLSWFWAWTEFKKTCPKATYEVMKNEKGLPGFETEGGCMVYTKVTPGAPWDEEPLEMWLPVMNARNDSIKNPSVTEVNKTVMRCLTKNLAMFGLGLYIYAGEDLPEEMKASKETLQEADKYGVGLDKLAIYNKCRETQLTDEMIQSAIKMKKDAKELAKKRLESQTAKGLPTTETIVLAKTLGLTVTDITQALGLVSELDLTDEMARKYIAEETERRKR